MTVRLRSWWLFLLISFLDPSSKSTAQEILTLETALKRAAASNPALNGHKMASVEASARARQARAATMPRVDFYEAGVTSDSGFLGATFSTLQQQPTGPMALGSRSANYLTQILASHEVLSGGTTSARRQRATNLADAAFQNHLAAMNELVFETAKAYCDVWLATQAESMWNATASKVEEELRSAREQRELGSGQEVDCKILEVSLERAHNDQMTGHDTLTVATSRLARLMGESVDTQYRIEELPSIPVKPCNSSRMITANRPELRALHSQKSAALQAARVARREKVPRLRLFGNLEFDSDRLQLENQSTTLGFIVNMNLFDAGESTSKRDETKAAARRLQYEEQNLHIAIELEIREAETHLADACRRQVAAEKLTHVTVEKLQRVSEQLDAGSVTRLDLIGARLRLAEVEFDEKTARHRAVVAGFAVLKARNMPIPPLGR